MREPMTRLRRITSWSALAVATLASLLMLVLPGYGNHVAQAFAIWPGVFVIAWGVGMTIETEGVAIRRIRSRRGASESNGA